MEPVVKKCGSQNFDCEKVLISAALLHDVFDHKYSNQEEAENGMTEIRNFLKNENFHEKEIDAVIKICENVSYSKEKKGKLEKLDHPVKLLRDIVSDADKLDAIGLSGIERCRMYSKHRNPTASELEIEENVREHMHEKLLRLLPEFIRTDPAKKIGEKLQCEMINYLESP